MNARTPHMTAVRRTAIALALSASALSLAACGVIGGDGGSSGSASPKKGDDITVGLLLPDTENARYDKIDYPVIKQQVLSLTHGKGKVVYANAGGNAARQSRQMDQMIADKVDVVLVDMLDSKAIAPGIRKAKDAGISVIAYDRLPQGPIDAYIAFDTQLAGQLEARDLLDELGSRPGNSKVVMMNGAATDPDAEHLKQGALGEFQGQVDIVKSYDVAGWSPQTAKKDMRQAIQAVGAGNIAGVVCANDRMAAAVIEALKEAGVSKLPPVTGQDPNLSAVQRIVSGDQLMSVYTSYSQEAQDAAEMAVAKVQGDSIEFDSLTRDKVDSPTEKNIPSMLVPVVELTRDDIKDTVIRDDVYTVPQICTATYEADCAAIGLK